MSILRLAAPFFLGLFVCFGPTSRLRAKDFMTVHGRAPAGWVKLEWPEKKAILFGQYAPNDREKQAIDKAIPTDIKPPTDPPRVLLFYRCQYPHVAIASGVHALTQLGKKTGVFDAVASDDPTDFDPETLKQYDAVILLHTTRYNQTIGPVGRAALVGFLRDGGGVAGIHAAADANQDWKTGAQFTGGIFNGHPWLPTGRWAIKLESPDHPINAAFDGEGFWLKDEIYAYRPGTFSRKRSRVLLSLDMSKPENSTSKKLHPKQRDKVDPDGDYPVAWVQSWNGGRVFYSNLGHNPETFWNRAVLRHYLDGILFAAGRIEADTTPSAELDSTNLAPAGPSPAGSSPVGSSPVSPPPK